MVLHVLDSAVGFPLEILIIAGWKLRSLAKITFLVFLVVQGGTPLLGSEFSSTGVVVFSETWLVIL